MFPTLERNVRSVVEEEKTRVFKCGGGSARLVVEEGTKVCSNFLLNFHGPHLFTPHTRLVVRPGLFDAAAAADVGQEIVTNNSGGNRTELGNSSYIAPLMSPYLRPSFAT